MNNSKLKNYSPFKFFLLVFILSIPFWILGATTRDLTKILPIKLPISALMTFCHLLATAILVYKERKVEGIKELLKLSFDFKKIKDRKWYVPIFLLMPTIAVLSYWYLKITGALLPEPPTPLLAVFSFFSLYFLLALLEKRWVGVVILLTLYKTSMGLLKQVSSSVLFGQYGILFPIAKHIKRQYGYFGNASAQFFYGQLWFGSLTILIKVFLR